MSILANLLSPVQVGEFKRGHFGVGPLHIPGPNDKFADIFSWTALDRVLNAVPSPHPRLKARYLNRPAPTDTSDDILAAARSGFSLILEDLDRYDARVGEVVDGLSADLSVPTRANMYLSFPGQQGYKNHYDTQDFLILQVEGNKEWFIFPRTIRDPLFYQKSHDDTPPSADSLLLRCTLSKGDLLYVPRGFWHYAVSVDQPSIHLTLAMFLRTGVDFLTWLVDELREDPRIRASFPPIGVGVPGNSLELADAYAPQIQQIRAALHEKLDNRDVAHRFREFTIAKMTPRSPFSLSAQLRLNSTAFLRNASGVRWRHHCFLLDEEARTLTGYGKVMELDRDAIAVVRVLLHRESWSLDELRHSLADIGDEALMGSLEVLIEEGHLALQHSATT